MQSALQAHGDAATVILEIAWVLAIGGGVIFIAVLALLAGAMAGPGPLRAVLARRGFIVGAGVVFPIVTLSALLFHTFSAAGALARETRQPAALTIEVAGELWWWRVRYIGAAGTPLLETANEIHLPAGEAVELRLVSHNVIHSFWVPSLAGKMDMIPGRVTRLRVRAREAGVFRGQCAEFCGAQHARMALHVVAHAPDNFAAWLQAQRAPAAHAATPLQRQGEALFARARCAACHAVRGTSAAGSLGPDLTHIGSRRWLAAGTLPMDSHNLAAWIAGSQHAKPGSRMPAYAGLAPEELHALSAYLENLR